MSKTESDVEAALDLASNIHTPAWSDKSSEESRGDDSPGATRTPIDIPSFVSHTLHTTGLTASDSGLVRWQTGTSAHPRRWPLFRKSYDSAIILVMEFVMTVCSNTGSSVVPYAFDGSGTSEELGLFYFTTLYLLGQAIGGLIFPPLAESFGGRAIYTTCAFAFAAFSALVGGFPTVPAIIFGRFMSGFLSAMPAVVACGSIENMWDIKARIWLVHFWIISSVLALALAPVIANAVSESSLGWQWLFYFAAIITGAIGIACFFMQESRPSQLLRQKVQRVARRTNFPHLSVDAGDHKPGLSIFVQEYLTMPLRLFFTEPIVFLTSIMGATVYAVIYLFTAALPQVYTEAYGYNTMQGSLVFLSIAVGMCFTLLPRAYDLRVACRKGVLGIEPEDKLFGFYVAAPVLAMVVRLLRPSAELYRFALGIDLLACIYRLQIVEFDYVLSGYLCDTYARRTASALAPMSFLRATLSVTFPLFGSAMFTNLGPNYAMFVLAGIATGFCGVAAMFRIWGKRVREKNPIAERARSVRDKEER